MEKHCRWWLNVAGKMYLELMHWDNVDVMEDVHEANLPQSCLMASKRKGIWKQMFLKRFGQLFQLECLYNKYKQTNDLNVLSQLMKVPNILGLRFLILGLYYRLLIVVLHRCLVIQRCIPHSSRILTTKATKQSWTDGKSLSSLIFKWRITALNKVEFMKTVILVVTHIQ